MMSYHRGRWFLLLSGLGFLVLLPGLCGASQIVVQPGESIAAALGAAAAGDSVMVAPGNYSEEGLILPAGVLLAGLVPADPPVLGALDGDLSLLICRDITGAEVHGIVFAGSDIPEYAGPQRGGAILIENAAVLFQGCRFLGLKAVYGGAIYAGEGAQPGFSQCVFEENEAATSGGAIAAAGAQSVDIDGCLFLANRAPLGGSVINSALQSRVNLSQSTLAGNGMQGSSDLATWNSGLLSVQASIIYGGAGRAHLGDAGSPVEMGCTDIFGNSEGDWVGKLAPLADGDGNLAEDPLFCGEVNPDSPWTLNEESPCAPNNQPECGLVGALPVGCSDNAGSDAADDLEPLANGKPLVTRLAANHPNPFNPSTTISLDISRTGAVQVDIYDVAGRRVRSLFAGNLESGSHELVWNGRGQDGRMAAAGVYFARLKTESVIDTRRMLLVK